jgi:5-methylcytosine-specific restriction enzyme A
MTRKEFIESNGATCQNWYWSWSFINKKQKTIIFGAWDGQTQGSITLILSDEWEVSTKGKKLSGYLQSREHIRLIEEEGYKLKTFPIIYSSERLDKNGIGPAKIDSFIPKLTEKNLVKIANQWYASDKIIEFRLPDEVGNTEQYIEGAAKVISVNTYERNSVARMKCIEHYGYKCAVCSFDFEKVYGTIGKEYIHVHHIIPIGSLKKEYKIDPIKDLVPICPNCHAIIHRIQPILTVDELRKILRSK